MQLGSRDLRYNLQLNSGAGAAATGATKTRPGTRIWIHVGVQAIITAAHFSEVSFDEELLCLENLDGEFELMTRICRLSRVHCDPRRVAGLLSPEKGHPGLERLEFGCEIKGLVYVRPLTERL